MVQITSGIIKTPYDILHHHHLALSGLLCADVPLRNYSLTHFVIIKLPGRI